MIAIVTLLFALPIGYFCRSTTAAYLGYVAIYAWAFTFQGVYLMMSWVGGDVSAFPARGFPLGYGLAALGVYAAGFGLVALGRYLRSRRATRRLAARDRTPTA